MARRKPGDESVSEQSYIESIKDTNEENSMTGTVTENIEETVESPVETNQSGAEEKVETKEAVEVPVEEQLALFKAAVESALAVKDESTGVLPEANVVEVTAAYRNLEGIKPKNAAKKLVEEAMKESVDKLQIPTARAYLTIQQNLTAGSPSSGSSGPKAERVPVDPHEAAAQQSAILRLAYHHMRLPEGLDQSKLDAKVNELVSSAGEEIKGYIEWLLDDSDDKPEEPTVSVVARNAAKLALGRSAKAGGTKVPTQSSGPRSTFTGVRKDIAAHISEAFADHPNGHFLSIADIQNFKSNEYTDESGTFRKPSSGAITARLFPSAEGKACTLTDVTPATVENSRGAKKK